MKKLKPNQFLLDGHLITEHPILFQTEMVQANLADRKTQTRRTKGLDSYSEKYNPMEFFRDEFREDEWAFFALTLKDGKQTETPNIKSPYGKPGDLLWVKETHLILETNHLADGNPFYYRAGFGSESEELRQDYIKAGFDYRWKPSIHMPKAASRIWAMIEDIRVEKVQDITEEDAIAEGCSLYGPFGEYRGSIHPNGGTMRYRAYNKASHAFQCLWESINGKASWDANPWVWVIKYRILSKTGRPSMEVIKQAHSDITNNPLLLCASAGAKTDNSQPIIDYHNV